MRLQECSRKKTNQRTCAVIKSPGWGSCYGSLKNGTKYAQDVNVHENTCTCTSLRDSGFTICQIVQEVRNTFKILMGLLLATTYVPNFEKDYEHFFFLLSSQK